MSNVSSKQHANAGKANPDLERDARTVAIHEAAEQRAEESRDQETERERARGDAALPAELVEDRREEQRERGARVDAHAHGDERHGDDDPAVKERPAAVAHASPSASARTVRLSRWRACTRASNGCAR